MSHDPPNEVNASGNGLPVESSSPENIAPPKQAYIKLNPIFVKWVVKISKCLLVFLVTVSLTEIFATFNHHCGKGVKWFEHNVSLMVAVLAVWLYLRTRFRIAVLVIICVIIVLIVFVRPWYFEAAHH